MTRPRATPAARTENNIQSTEAAPGLEDTDRSTDGSAPDRSATDRGTTNPSAPDRSATDRGTTNPSAPDRSATDRGTTNPSA
ncbi:hypothetical protein, partial [Streptomyces tuirus]